MYKRLDFIHSERYSIIDCIYNYKGDYTHFWLFGRESSAENADITEAFNRKVNRK